MTTSVELFCVCRLFDFRDDEDPNKNRQFATFLYEGGKFEFAVNAGTFTEDMRGHIFKFQLLCEPSQVFVQGKDGRNFSVTNFRPIKGVKPHNLEIVE